MDLKGTKTEKNLLTAFAGESQARNRYTFYAKIAKKEGYVQISKIFEETANHEMAHAKRLLNILKEGNAADEVLIEAAYPARSLLTTEENLRAAAAGEEYEFTKMYPDFAKIAEEEGFDTIAHTFRMIAKAETWHHERYMILADNMANGRVFKRKENVQWVCENCGYVHDGDHPPDKCPACLHAKAYFKIHSPVF